MATYFAGKDAVAIIDGVTMKVESGTLNLSIKTDEVTNTSTGGYYEDVDTTRMAKVTKMSCVYDGDDPPTFNEGDLVDTDISIPGGPSLTGTFRVGSIDLPILDVDAAIKYSFDLTSQGVYEWGWGGA